MGRANRIVAALALGSFALLACAPQASGPTERPAVAEPARPTILRVALPGDVDHFGLRFQLGGAGSEFNQLVNAFLTKIDNREEVRPYLLETLPSQDDGTWVVNADGTMRTTLRLRPGVMWHDGQPMTAHDIAFAYRLYRDPEMPNRWVEPERLMTDVVARDDRTAEVNWSEPYFFAGYPEVKDLVPLPRHLLEDLYNRDKQGFINSSFWSSAEYVGAGPFRVTEHERGVGITLTANPLFFMGKPKVDTVRLELVPDPNARVARLLSGVIDFTEALTADQAAVLRDQWKGSSAGVVYVSIANTLTLRTQFRDVPNHQSALRDVRVRRALIHAIDRDALADAATTGLSTAADTTFPRDHYLYPRIEQAIAKYPFDIRRTEELLTEAGWGKGADGMFRNPAGQLFDIEVWAGATNTIRTTAATVVVDYWKRAGLNGRQFGIPQGSDREFQASFPGFDVSGGDPGGYRTITSAEIPRPENRFAGPNSGSYANPEFDALVFRLNATLQRAERDDITVATERLFTMDVAKPTLIYDVKPAAGLSQVGGIRGYSGGANSRSYLFNSEEWTVE